MALPLADYLAIPFLVGTQLLDEARRPAGPLWRRAGVLAGLWLGLLAGSLLQIVIWFLASRLIPLAIPSISNTYAFWIWPAVLGFLLLANTVGLSMVFLLALLVRRIRPSLLWAIWTLLWLLVFAQVNFKSVLMEASIPMQLDAFYNIFFEDLRFSPSLGLGLSAERVIGMAAWFLGLGLLAGALGLAPSLLAGKRRARLALPALILAGALAAAGGYALNTQAAATYAAPVSPYDPQIDAWVVEGHQAEVNVDASTGALSGASRLSLRRIRKVQKPELVLRLNPGLALSSARDASGAELPVQRLGDGVVLSLPAIPEERLQVELAWQGSLQISTLEVELEWRFRDGPGTVPYLYAPAPLRGLVGPSGRFPAARWELAAVALVLIAAPGGREPPDPPHDRRRGGGFDPHSERRGHLGRKAAASAAGFPAGEADRRRRQHAGGLSAGGQPARRPGPPAGGGSREGSGAPGRAASALRGPGDGLAGNGAGG